MLPIRIEQLQKSFRGKKGIKVEALKGVTFDVDEGEVFGFLGPNGAGKSTIIKTLMGQIRPSSGNAFLFSQATGTPQARQRVGYLPENPAFYDFLTANEYLQLVGRTFGMESDQISQESERVLDKLSLTGAANRPIRGYSKGMVQRLGLAQTLLHDPDLYILDEPMSGLDPVGRALVKQVILELKKSGKTVFFSTHVISDVEAVCDRVGIIAAGELQAIHEVSHVLKSGIEGYSILVRNCSSEHFSDFEVKNLGVERWSVTIPSESYRDFTERLISHHGEVEFVEPLRRSLEALFLEVIDRVG